MNPSPKEHPENSSPFPHQRMVGMQCHQSAPSNTTYRGQYPSPNWIINNGTQSHSQLADHLCPHAHQTNLGKGEPRPLPQLASPSKFDVICARGSSAAKHVGNLRFREIIRQSLPRYNAAKTKMEKSLIVTSIVDAVRDSSPNGGFIKQDRNGMWYDVGDAIAREKVGQNMRDQVGHELAFGLILHHRPVSLATP
jgi:hypothetical protein